jgi:hypothetical protein
MTGYGVCRGESDRVLRRGPHPLLAVGDPRITLPSGRASLKIDQSGLHLGEPRCPAGQQSEPAFMLRLRLPAAAVFRGGMVQREVVRVHGKALPGGSTRPPQCGSQFEVDGEWGRRVALRLKRENRGSAGSGGYQFRWRHGPGSPTTIGGIRHEWAGRGGRPPRLVGHSCQGGCPDHDASFPA